MNKFFLMLAASFAASTAFAQAPPPGGVRVMGVLTAVSPTALTIKQADGTSVVLNLASTYRVNKSKPIDIDSIKPGQYVATANTNINADSGKSIELRMFDSAAAPKGQNSFSRPMTQPNTTMTNGTVQTITKGAGGRELDVSYPGGVRHIVVPPEVKVMGISPATPQDLSAGETVSALGAPDAAGHPVASFVIINQP